MYENQIKIHSMVKLWNMFVIGFFQQLAFREFNQFLFLLKENFKR